MHEGRGWRGIHPRKVFPSHSPKIMVGVGEGWGVDCGGVWGGGEVERGS